MKDLLRKIERGDRLSARDQNIIRDLLRGREVSGSRSIVDSTGTHERIRIRESISTLFVKVTTGGASGDCHVTVCDDDGNSAGGEEYENVEVAGNITTAENDLGILVKDKDENYLFYPSLPVGGSQYMVVQKDSGDALDYIVDWVRAHA